MLRKGGQVIPVVGAVLQPGDQVLWGSCSTSTELEAAASAMVVTVSTSPPKATQVWSSALMRSLEVVAATAARMPIQPFGTTSPDQGADTSPTRFDSGKRPRSRFGLSLVDEVVGDQCRGV